MASFHCSRRLFSISSFKSAFRVRPTTTTNHSPHRQFSPLFIRTNVYQLGSVQSLLPLHSTVASSRMVSYLSIDSRNCQAVSQVTLSCNHPGP
ncbi:protein NONRESPONDING TO OXYLIPINS 2, mitochondrial-like [Trifolium pratense]|uniref:Uncharacterized protein n=1 Tax=Trifolium pratense TaxID=57577 RepID=A0ACB0L935_TRIPR|nr:protein NONRESPONDING TO OXYLIPINS 2, mitochondrial-like [Trifolium pratense]CAJ2665125.1 unnamed protein product [Trifolium pratense]